MDVGKLFLNIYLGIGFIYAIYIWLFAGDPWYAIPFNILGGPLNIVIQTFRAFFRKTYELKDTFKGKKAVIFDLDGTIIDSQPFRDQAMENILDRINAGWVFRKYHSGLNEVEKWEAVLAKEKDIKTDFTAKELADQTRKEYLKLHKEIDTIKGFWHLAYFLKEEKKFKLGLATNSNREVVTEVLKRLGADDIFDFTITGDEVKRRKPNPQIYKKAAKGLGVRSKDVVVFEDTIVGATAARKAGMEVIVIWDGEDEDPDEFPKGIHFFVPDFEEISDSIDKSRKEQLEEVAKELEAEGIE